MEILKEEVINAISKLPESDDIMYRLYVIDKIRKSEKAIHDGKTISIETLKEELKSW